MARKKPARFSDEMEAKPAEEITKEDLIDPEPLAQDELTDDEILEALAPAERQLRALQQIAKTVDAYSQVKSQIAGLEKRLVDIQQEAAHEQSNLELTKTNINEEIQRLNASIGEKRIEFEARFKKDMGEMNAKIQDTQTKLAELEANLQKENEHFAGRMKEIDERLTEKEDSAHKMIDELNAKIAEKQAEHGKIEKDFAALLRKHGIAPQQEVV